MGFSPLPVNNARDCLRRGLKMINSEIIVLFFLTSLESLLQVTKETAVWQRLGGIKDPGWLSLRFHVLTQVCWSHFPSGYR